MAEPSVWPFSNYNVFGIVNGIKDERVREVINRTFAGRAVKIASTLYVYGGNANSAAYMWLLAETGTLNTKTALIINSTTETGFGLVVGGVGIVEVGASATTTDYEAMMESISASVAHVTAYRDNTKTLIGSRIDTAGAFTTYSNPATMATPPADRISVGGFEDTGVDTLIAKFDDGTTRTLARKDVSITGPWTPGSVLFASDPAGFATQDNANFFWDDTNNILRAKYVAVTSIQATQTAILALTPTAGRLAWATDIEALYVADGTNWHRNSAYMDRDLSAPDMGWVQTSNRRGYGSSYVSNKLIANCSLGDNSRTTVAGLRYHPATGKIQVYLSGSWRPIVENLNLEEVNGILAHTPIGYTTRIKVFSGTSYTLGLNGYAIVNGYLVSMGAYPKVSTIDGGTF